MFAFFLQQAILKMYYWSKRFENMIQEDFAHQSPFVPLASVIPLNIRLRSAGHGRTSSMNYLWDGMKRGNREFVIWQYTIAGCGHLECEEGSFDIPAGSAFLLTFPDKHRYFLPASSESWEFLHLGFDGCEAIRLARALREKYSPVSTRYASAEVVKNARELMQLTVEQNTDDAAKVSTLSYQFFMNIVSSGNREYFLPEKDPIVLIHNYCLRHIAEDISVDDLAAYSGYSRSHFYRIFCSRTGKSPHAYLLELRARTAMRMLQNGNISVKEVSSACGFNDVSYFCKVFRRFCGTAPSNFLSRKMK